MHFHILLYPASRSRLRFLSCMPFSVYEVVRVLVRRVAEAHEQTNVPRD